MYAIQHYDTRVNLYVHTQYSSVLYTLYALMSSCPHRETVEESYSDLQFQIHTHQEEHVQTMATLATQVAEAKKQNNDMSDRVRIHTHAHAHAHDAHAHAHDAHAHAHAHTHAHMHMCARIHMHTHVHTHTHACT